MTLVLVLLLLAAVLGGAGVVEGLAWAPSHRPRLLIIGTADPNPTRPRV